MFVSALREQGVDPTAIRLALLRHHYRASWEWTDTEIPDALETLSQWRRAVGLGTGAAVAPVESAVLSALTDDLNAPAALRIVQAWVDETLGQNMLGDNCDRSAGENIRRLVDAALGLTL